MILCNHLHSINLYKSLERMERCSWICNGVNNVGYAGQSAFLLSFILLLLTRVRKKNQILLVKVNKQLFIHPVCHLTIMLINRDPIIHASHDSQTVFLDDVVDVAEQEHHC